MGVAVDHYVQVAVKGLAQQLGSRPDATLLFNSSVQGPQVHCDRNRAAVLRGDRVHLVRFYVCFAPKWIFGHEPHVGGFRCHDFKEAVGGDLVASLGLSPGFLQTPPGRRPVSRRIGGGQSSLYADVNGIVRTWPLGDWGSDAAVTPVMDIARRLADLIERSLPEPLLGEVLWQRLQ
jgi:hypothetical protein